MISLISKKTNIFQSDTVSLFTSSLLTAQEEEEHFPWCLWYEICQSAHAEAGSVQTSHTQDEGSEEEEGWDGCRGAGHTGTQSDQSRKLRCDLPAGGSDHLSSGINAQQQIIGLSVCLSVGLSCRPLGTDLSSLLFPLLWSSSRIMCSSFVSVINKLSQFPWSDLGGFKKLPFEFQSKDYFCLKVTVPQSCISLNKILIKRLFHCVLVCQVQWIQYKTLLYDLKS